MSGPLLLISNNSEDAQFAERVARIAELPLEIFSSAKEGVKIIENGSPSAIFVDVSSDDDFRRFESEIQESVGLFSDKVNPNLIHYISSKDLDALKSLIVSPIFGHFLIRNFSSMDDSADFYGRLVAATRKERAFGLSAYLKPGASIQSVKFQNSLQKQSGVDAIRNYLIAAKFKPRMADSISNAVDEILMNAMFDAPVDEVGKHIYSATPRTTKLELTGRSQVEMTVGFDGLYVGICVSDQYGSIDKPKLLSHVGKRYTNEEYQVRMSMAGAGIGLSNVFASGGSLYFLSESGVKTEVMVFFKRAENFRAFKDQFRFLSTQFYFE